LSENGPTSKASKRYPMQLRERAVQQVFEHRGEYASEWRAITTIAHKCGMTGETLRKWVRQAELDGGTPAGTTRPQTKSAEAQHRISELEREIEELRRDNEILRAASAFFLRELDPQQRR